MKKRFCSLLLAFIIFATINNTVFAVSDATLYGDKLECQSGDTVKYSVYIKDNPGIAGYLVSIYLTDDWIYFDESVKMGDFSELGSITTSYEPQRVNVLWFNSDNVSNDGVLFSIDVHISPSAPCGDYPVYIAVSDKNTLNEKLKPVNFVTENGCISVKHVDGNINDSSGNEKQMVPKSNKKYWIIAVILFATVFLFVIAKYMKKENRRK